MADNRKILDETAESLGSATRALNLLGDVIEGTTADPLRMTGHKGATKFLESNFVAYDEMLLDAYRFVSDDWEHIENNDARIDELRRFFKAYGAFKDAVSRLDELFLNNEQKVVEITGNRQLSKEYVILICQWDEKFAFTYDFLAKIDERLRAERSPYTGMSLALKDFFYGLTDAQLEDALVMHEFPIFPGTWTGPMTNATYFGHHFHLSCLQMNRLFKYRNGDGELERLHYTRFPDVNIKETSGIATVLKPYKFIKPIK